MNPTTPKIVSAWKSCEGTIMTLDELGQVYARRGGFHRGDTDARLAESGQRAIWPEGHGVAVIEDIPKPEPLPTAYLCIAGKGKVMTWDNVGNSAEWECIATVTFDENDVATVVRHDR